VGKDMATESARDTSPGTATAGLGRRPPGQLWQVPAFLVGLFALLLMVTGRPFRRDTGAAQLERDLAAIHQTLSQTRTPAEPVLALAEGALARSVKYPQRAGEAHFALGSVFQRLADQAPAPRAAELRQQALFHLEQAELLGVPGVDQDRLVYRLAKARFYAGGDVRRTIDTLERTVAQDADDAAEGYGMLVQLYLRLPVPDVDNALKANQKQLELTDEEEVLAPARLLRGDLLLRKGQKMEALKVLDRIRPGAPREFRGKARYLVARTAQEEGMWAKAAPLWQEILKDPEGCPEGPGRVRYHLAQCFCKMDQPDEVVAAAWQTVLPFGGEEAQAAAFRLGWLRLHGPNPAAAAEAFKLALDKVAKPADFRNSLLDLGKARKTLEEGCQLFLKAHDYEHCLELAELYQKVAPPGVAQDWVGQAAEARARELLDKAHAAEPAEANPLQEEALAQFRKAAAAYQEAAGAREGDEQTDLLWHSAECFLEGQDYPGAVPVLEQFVQLKVAPEKLGKAWFTLAETRRTLRQPEESREAYYKCIEVNAGAYAYRARYQLALDEADRNHLDEAEAMLKQNLDLMGPSADRDAHEKTLFKLAGLLFQRRNFDLAAVRLQEAVDQYPDHPDILGARDRLADSYRQLAEQADQKVQSTEAAREDVKSYYRRQRVEFLDKAATAYQKLADDLDARQANGPLTPAEQTLLRKALFGAADCHLDGSDYPEAVRRYNLLTERYRGRVEGLIACQKIVFCIGRMSDRSQVRTALETAQAAVKSAQAALAAMPDELFTGRTGTWTRSDWQGALQRSTELLDLAARQLNPPPPPAQNPTR
jgi:tetratricopeptide (TPR) repeat protein